MSAALAAHGWLRGALGGLLGGLAGATAAVLVTLLIKELLGFVTRQDDWLLIVLPLVGLALSVLVLHGWGHGAAVQTLVPEPASPPTARLSRWTTFHTDLARADLTADVVATAGREERFPWHLAPIRATAIVATVGLGAPLGTESPAAHLGVSAGAWIGHRPWLRVLVRPAAVAGGAAGVAALIAIPLVGTAFVLELGRRNGAGLTAERVVAGVTGGLVGWAVNSAFGLELISLVVPDQGPGSLSRALATAVLLGAAAGLVASLTGLAIYRARGWRARPVVKLVVGASVVLACALAIAGVADASASVGPGGGAIAWASSADATVAAMLLVVLLRAAATTAAVAAGGCGGFFVPFLALGDVTGRAMSGGLGISGDLAGSLGAAGAIAGGYRLPVTAVMLVLGVGGPAAAQVTDLAGVVVATASGLAVAWLVDRAGRIR